MYVIVFKGNQYPNIYKNEILKEVYDKHKYFSITLRNNYTRRHNEVIRC